MTSQQQQEYQLLVSAQTPQLLEDARRKLSQGQLVTSPSKETPQHVQLAFARSQLQSPSAFRAELYLARLTSKALGHVLLSADILPSTQTLLQDNGGLLPEGTLCVADQQQIGKGRGGNRWVSPPGCLMFSACTKLSMPGERLPFVQYVVTLAVLQAIQDEARQLLQGETIDVRIKWPNDLYSGNLKVGGVLCHSAYRERAFHVVMGVGLNLSNQQPTTCINDLIQQKLQQQGGSQIRMVPPEALLAAIMQHLEEMLTTLSTRGFQPLHQMYIDNWLHSGQQVMLEEKSDSGAVQHVPVTIQGIADNAFLLALDADGQSVELHPDGNSLDLFEGLVRKKVQT